ncbi:hypothetical protein [Streptomyces flavidovirens]|uniref:hypothetical protein n=1 Tax=Streptomyces flavidovirens TaxID=67298 RepID=UPI0004135E20|nr:hypothetical protein [Streptomyces flavidovirens]
MTDEARVDKGHPLTGGCLVEQLGGLLGGVAVGPGVPYDESQCPQIALERRSGYRRAGEDGGRQTNSLLGAGQGLGLAWHAALRPGTGAKACRQRLSDERKQEFMAR